MLVPLNDLKNYLGIPLVDTTYDTFLTLQGEVVSEAISEYCSRRFELLSYTQKIYKDEAHQSYDNKKLMLRGFPVISIASFVEKSDDLDPGVDVEDYRISNEMGLVTKNNGNLFTGCKTFLEVEYQAGYATIPVLIQNVVYSVVEERYNKKKAGIDVNFGSDVQRISIPGAISIDFDYSLQNNERKTHLGQILGNHVNVLDAFRSDRAVTGSVKVEYVS